MRSTSHGPSAFICISVVNEPSAPIDPTQMKNMSCIDNFLSCNQRLHVIVQRVINKSTINRKVILLLPRFMIFGMDPHLLSTKKQTNIYI